MDKDFQLSQDVAALAFVVAQGTKTTVDEVHSQGNNHSYALDVINRRLTAIEKECATKQDISELNETTLAIKNALAALPQIQEDLQKVVSERKWYKAAAGAVITASIAVTSFIIFLISYSSEISALKSLLIQFIEQTK